MDIIKKLSRRQGKIISHGGTEYTEEGNKIPSRRHGAHGGRNAVPLVRKHTEQKNLRVLRVSVREKNVSVYPTCK